jgi:hydroxymethylbilane synthase
MTSLRIGTRGSRLALWQANYVRDQLRTRTPELSIDLLEIQTAGDRVREVPLSQIGGDGVFTKEIERALLAGEVDVAVHSLKDLPTTDVPGLVLAAVPPRGRAGDVFVSRKHRSFAALPPGARVGTSSIRRRAQLLHRRPDLNLVNLRGNVETRLRKLDEQDLDAIILAEAGLVRLQLQEAITEILDAAWMLPAVGQGALGLQCRSEDRSSIALIQQLNDLPTRQAVFAERALLRGLGGGCQVPIGAATAIQGQTLTLRGAVLPPDGTRRIEGQVSGPIASSEELGRQLAGQLMAQGARELLER